MSIPLEPNLIYADLDRLDYLLGLFSLKPKAHREDTDLDSNIDVRHASHPLKSDSYHHASIELEITLLSSGTGEMNYYFIF